MATERKTSRGPDARIIARASEQKNSRGNNKQNNGRGGTEQKKCWGGKWRDNSGANFWGKIGDQTLSESLKAKKQ